MRSRVSLFTTILVVGLFVVPHFAHASIPFFGPIIPKGDNVCPAGWGMMMTVINNIIELLLTLAIVFVAPFMIAYAGFLLVVNQGNASKLADAKKVLTNTVVGIVIALAGWMIVDAIMAVLYNPGVNAGQTWASLITSSGSACLPQAGANKNDPLNPTVTTPGVSVVAPGTASGKLSFESGIDAQISTESGALATALACIGTNLTSNVAISSISDNKITSGQQSFATCRAKGQPTCAHTANSCHYGGRTCGDSSYAVDLKGDATSITNAAQACNLAYLNEGNHIHVSVGSQNNCGCDASLD